MSNKTSFVTTSSEYILLTFLVQFKHSNAIFLEANQVKYIVFVTKCNFIDSFVKNFERNQHNTKLIHRRNANSKKKIGIF